MTMLEEVLRRGWTNLVGRSDGLMDFRVILQPTVATLIAIRAGIKDARKGVPPFLWALFSRRGRRRDLLSQGWKDVGTVFVVAVILDAIYQIVMHSSIYPLEMLLTATVLAFLPYALLRGIVTRIVRTRPGQATHGVPSDMQQDQ